ncbi:MAG TPA: NAD-dependent epimerase/dehydratase family protein, partial [Acidimicrobiales bacterium]|nr:NAD-dependent epimerase/dehydratase family protein [Acidimicrobiales bacterium]
MSTTSELPLSLAGSEWPFRGPRTCSSARDSADALPRVLVLGAGGFIGSHVAKLMASAPTSSDGIFVTRLSTRQPRFPTCGQWTCFNLAESSSRSLGHLLERLAPQVVVNCTGATEGSAADLRELNVGVVHKLVSALASAAPAHLVHLGSAAEYGAPKDWRPVKET